MRCARRAIRAVTAGCGITCARCARASRSNRLFGSRRRRVARTRWTLRRLPCRGGAVTPYWWCWDIRGCCGCVSTLGRRWRCLIDGLESAFAHFGGVPRELLFDQMRAVVLSDGRGDDGSLVLNAEFLRFAAHWGFAPRACRPYRARTKGKVERPIRYLRPEFFFYGRTFVSDADLNDQALRWLKDTANVRRHATTGERPVDRFERDERTALRPLAPQPYRRFGYAPERPAGPARAEAGAGRAPFP